jgi:hypothetical protein
MVEFLLSNSSTKIRLPEHLVSLKGAFVDFLKQKSITVEREAENIKISTNHGVPQKQFYLACLLLF